MTHPYDPNDMLRNLPPSTDGLHEEVAAYLDRMAQHPPQPAVRALMQLIAGVTFDAAKSALSHALRVMRAEEDKR